MNGPTKTVGPPLTPLPARKSRGVLEKVLDNADAVIDGMWPKLPEAKKPVSENRTPATSSSLVEHFTRPPAGPRSRQASTDARII